MRPCLWTVASARGYYEYSALVEWYLQGKSEKTLSHCHFVKQESHMDWPGRKPRPLVRAWWLTSPVMEQPDRIVTDIPSLLFEKIQDSYVMEVFSPHLEPIAYSMQTHFNWNFRVIWDTAPYGHVEVDRRCRAVYCPHQSMNYHCLIWTQF
jgi:hypothetical protein